MSPRDASGDRLGPPQPVAEGALAAPPDVVAAIGAAVELCWPRPRPSGGRERGSGPEFVWRLSGRWWSKPVPLRRDRPWTTHGREHGQVGSQGS